jgi:RNA-directed DNA polymerase
MSAPSEPNVDATPIVVVALPEEPTDGRSSAALEQAKAQRAARAQARVEHAARWKAITESGGADAYIESELRARGVKVDEDPSRLSESQKAAFKERKKAEAAAIRELRRTVWEAYRAVHVVHVGAGIFFQDEIALEPAAEAARLLRAKEHDLTSLDSVQSLATGLGVTLPELRYLSYHRDVQQHSHYHLWTIPKRDGSRRTITAPKARLKAAQRWLLRNVVDKLPVHHAAHGFLPDRSIVSNAEVHAGADVVVKIDLADFFPTVTFPRVKGLLRKGGLPESVAILAALIATEPPREVVEFRGKTLFVATGPRALPQGAPTSPGITNALCMRMDRRLSGLARTLGFAYTRYADDLTFSWRGEGGRSRAPIGALLRGVRVIVKSEGFQVHPSKTRVMGRGGAQRVTGLVVNKADNAPATRVPRDVIRRLRAAIHNREQGRPGKEGETLEQLKGIAAFVFMADPVKGRQFLDRLAALEEKAGPG